ncbi:FHA domain-containing protein [Deinococcus sp. Arct2-2]|uniref:FHA domain-containing protein n=1 Tax=Deinococcus sp. Arct2-2 TaxID=2568653 RepID=UPI0010A57A6E|nr:FHA domain-containing protein [Deinococcus sp. Arct2-2]THF70829.1 FHA domain-containing protein [Deinococcus sp. Arct2-2]
MTILCTVCGTANPEGTTYCEGCGVELSAATAPTPAATVEASPEAVPQVDSAGAASSGTEATPQAEAAVSEAPVSENPVSETPVTESTAPTERAQEAAPVGGAFAEGTGSEPAAQAPVSEGAVSEGAVSEGAAPEVAASEATVAEVAPSDLPASEIAAAPAAETPAPAPVLTGEAKLGIKKFGAPTGEFIPLQGDHLVVGRFDASSGPVDIDLSGLGGQEHISRRHAELSREQGVWAVRDLGSTNGVYIKRKGEAGFSPRLQEPTTLADGDELAFGNLMLMFHQS